MASGARKLCFAAEFGCGLDHLCAHFDKLQLFTREESVEALEEIGVAFPERLDAALEPRETRRDHGVVSGFGTFDPGERRHPEFRHTLDAVDDRIRVEVETH